MAPPESPIELPPFPFEPASEERARHAIVEAARGHEVKQTGLFSAISDCVRDLRASGMSPEAMVVTMKAFVRHAVHGERDARGMVARPLMDQVIEWSIQEYYRP